MHSLGLFLAQELIINREYIEVSSVAEPDTEFALNNPLRRLLAWFDRRDAARGIAKLFSVGFSDARWPPSDGQFSGIVGPETESICPGVAK